DRQWPQMGRRPPVPKSTQGFSIFRPIAVLCARVRHNARPDNEKPSSRLKSMPIPEVLRGHLRLPIIGAPMFIVSTPRLVLAQCKAGIVGAFPALNARPASQLDDWLAQITE